MAKDSHFLALSRGLKHLHQQGFLVDLSISAADGQVGIHSFILLLFSDFFQQEVKKGKGLPVIDAKGYKKGSVEKVVNFLYDADTAIDADLTELIKCLHLDLTIDQRIRKKKISKGDNINSIIATELKLLRNLTFELSAPKLLKQPRLCADVSVKTGKDVHQCHKVMLAAMSKYFEVMFSSGMKECQEAVTVDLQGVDTNTFNLILNFIYTGNIQMTVTNVQELLSTAVYLQIHLLQEVIERFLIDQLDITNCVDMLKLGDLFSCQLLMQGSWAYIVDNFQRISKLKLIRSLQMKEIEKLCLDDNLNVDDETLVLQFVLDWLSNNTAGEKAVKNLLECVRVGLIDDSYLQKIVEHKEIVASNHIIKTNMIKLMSKKGLHQNHQARKEKTFIVIKRSSYTSGIDVACFSLSQSRWFALRGLPQSSGGTGFATCVVKNSIYVTGGTATPRSNYLYDIDLNTWTVLPEMMEGRSSHAVGHVNGCLYVLGGSEISSGAFNVVSSIEKYDIAQQTWTVVGQMEIPTYDSAFAVVKSRFYVFGGSMGLMSGVYIKDIQCFDTVTLTCSVIYHHLPFTLSLAVACSNGCDIYITCPNGKVIHYNEDSAPTVISEAKGSQLMGYATVYHSHSVYIMGGYSTIGESDVIHRFDLRQNKEVPYTQTKLPFKKETNQLFGAVCNISRKFLDKEYPSPAEKNAKRRIPMTSRR